MIHSATNVRKLALTFTPSLWWVRTCGIFRWAWSSTSTWTTATKQTMESKSVRYMMILILCQRRQWPHHLFFGVNLRSGLGGGVGAGARVPGWGDRKGRRTVWLQIISLLVWAREIKKYSQAIVYSLFRKLQVVQCSFRPKLKQKLEDTLRALEFSKYDQFWIDEPWMRLFLVG